MKLLTFLGTTNYQPATYVWRSPDGRQYEHATRYAPAAACRFLRADGIIVLATSEACAVHLAGLRQEVDPAVDISVEPIPGGANEQELWQIFGAVARCARQAPSVALDITHGFRSLPVIALLAVAFLRAVHRVEVERVVYGALQACDTSVKPPRAPLFDLTPMLSLLEWAIAADRLIRSGDARDMAACLRGAAPPWPQPQLFPLRSKITRLSTKLDEVSNDLRLIRAYDTLEAAERLSRELAEAEQCAASVPPFAELLAEVRATFTGHALAKPAAPENVAACLERQRALIRWYLSHQYYVEAATLAREWVVSWWAVAQQGKADLLSRDTRDAAEHALGELHAANKCGCLAERASGLPEQVARLWSRIIDVRNDIDHAEMRRGALAPSKLIERIEQCVGEIEKLPLPHQPVAGPVQMPGPDAPVR